MGNQGDALPDPSKKRAGKSKLKALICIGLLLLCFCIFVPTVCAPGDKFPDPSAAPLPIFNEGIDGKPIGNLVMGIRSSLSIE